MKWPLLNGINLRVPSFCRAGYTRRNELQRGHLAGRIRPTFWLLFLLLFAANLQAQPQPQPQPQPQSLLVLDIEDGDTLVVEINGQSERLQLAGIDAPEAGENAKLKRDLGQTGLTLEKLLDLGRAATDHLRSLVKAGDRLRVSGPLDKRDRYGRITALARDSVGRSLSEQMVQDGYAVALRRHAPDGELKSQLIALEESALAGHKGLWGRQRPDTMAWSGRKQ